MTTTNKVRSTVSYWHEFPDGSDLKVNVFINDNPHQWHLKGAKNIPEDTMLEVVVRKSAVENIINTPIGGIPTMKETDRKVFDMTFKQYKEFIIRFWETGPDYYDMI